jgi:hypothetical protein
VTSGTVHHWQGIRSTRASLSSSFWSSWASRVTLCTAFRFIDVRTATRRQYAAIGIWSRPRQWCRCCARNRQLFVPRPRNRRGADCVERAWKSSPFRRDAVPTRPRETVPRQFRVLRMIHCSDTLQDKRRPSCSSRDIPSSGPGERLGAVVSKCNVLFRDDTFSSPSRLVSRDHPEQYEHATNRHQKRQRTMQYFMMHNQHPTRAPLRIGLEDGNACNV